MFAWSVNRLTNLAKFNQVVRYLQYYNKLSSWQAYNGRIADINLHGLTLACRGKTYRIPLDPPMTSYREARERVVQMDKEAVAGLGQSDITVKEFLPPTGIWALPFAVISAAFIGFSQRWWFEQGGLLEPYLGSGFAKFNWTVQPYIIAFMLFMHTAEAAYFMQNKLGKHGVNPRTSLFWTWTFTVFVEGYFGFMRFNGHVDKKAAEKAKQKH